MDYWGGKLFPIRVWLVTSRQKVTASSALIIIKNYLLMKLSKEPPFYDGVDFTCLVSVFERD